MPVETLESQLTIEAVKAVYERPLMDLLYDAATVHRAHHPKNEVQVSTLLSIKTGACPEDCKYCSQSAHYNTDLPKEPLIEVETVVNSAREARDSGSSRFCMGAAWRKVADRDMLTLIQMVKAVKAEGMEACMTLGTLSADQAAQLKDAGLDYYNHNLDTSEEHYENIITTRSYAERLNTIQTVRDAGINVCSGGIIGLGESGEDRISFLYRLAAMNPPPESVPINRLVPIPGTPLADNGVDPVEWDDILRMIATARILMPRTQIRLSAGRETMSEELQTMCFLVGANSIFSGDKLLTTSNRGHSKDGQLFHKIGIRASTLDD